MIKPTTVLLLALNVAAMGWASVHPGILTLSVQVFSGLLLGVHFSDLLAAYIVRRNKERKGE